MGLTLLLGLPSRIPRIAAMVIAFMGFCAAMVGERIDPKLGQRLLAPLIGLRLFSMIQWARLDDLRLYGIVQFYPMLAIPVLLSAFRPRYSHGWLVIAAICAYAFARQLDHADGAVYELGELISGHTLKHLSAAHFGSTFRRRSAAYACIACSSCARHWRELRSDL